MATFYLFGKYSRQAMANISPERTDQAVGIIENLGGKFVSGHALLGVQDIVLIVELPDTRAAMKASVALSKLTGIAFSTAHAVPLDEFDRLVGEV